MTEQFDFCLFCVYPLGDDPVTALVEWRIPVPVSEVREVLGLDPGEMIGCTLLTQDQCTAITDKYFPVTHYDVEEYDCFVEEYRDYAAYHDYRLEVAGESWWKVVGYFKECADQLGCPQKLERAISAANIRLTVEDLADVMSEDTVRKIHNIVWEYMG